MTVSGGDGDDDDGGEGEKEVKVDIGADDAAYNSRRELAIALLPAAEICGRDKTCAKNKTAERWDECESRFDSRQQNHNQQMSLARARTRCAVPMSGGSDSKSPTRPTMRPAPASGGAPADDMAGAGFGADSAVAFLL